jgi:hypothetical protein
MNDNEPKHRDRLQRYPGTAGLNAYLQSKESETEATVASCKAFGYLRGIRDSATSLEFRFLNGNSTWFPYSLMGIWKYNPSEGLLLKFNSDLIYLVLIRGSNLDKPLNEGAINLTHAGLQRHRVLWIREMTKEEIRKVGEAGPTIDSIDIAEFESHDALKEWLKKKASAFLHEQA